MKAFATKTEIDARTDLKSKRLNIRITPVLARRFERARERMGHSITDALIMLITQYCERAEK